jgi:hypothetical protein
MALPEPAERQKIHTRAIVLEGYRRADGLWDIEAHLTDTKSYAFSTAERGQIEPGEALHRMLMRLTVDDNLVVRDACALTESAPYRMCPEITGNFQRLIGLQIGAGWTRAVRERVGGIQGCTHHVELLGPLATVAFQTIVPLREREARERGQTAYPTAPGRAPAILETCHAYARDSPVVKRQWPDFYAGPQK